MIKPLLHKMSQPKAYFKPRLEILVLGCFMVFFGRDLFAQQVSDSTGVSTEVIDVVKSYTPSINLRPKTKWIFSESEGGIAPRPEFEYAHEVLGVSPSDLPQVIAASGPQKGEGQKYLANYLRIWLGTQASAGLEGFFAHEFNSDSDLTAAIDHQQLNGPIDGVSLDTDWAETGFRTQWRHKWQNRSATLGLSLKRSALQWYGVPDTLVLNPDITDDFGQIYYRGSVNHHLGSNGGWFTGMDNKLSVFSDRFGVAEWKFSTAPKAELYWDKRLFSFNANFSFLSTTLTLDDPLINTDDYRALNADFGAQTDIDFGALNVNFGARIWGHNAGSDGTLRLFPELELSYPILARKLNAYLEFSGHYEQYEASSLSQSQVFLAPGQILKPQVDRQIVRLGINGSFTDLWQYNLGFEYRNFENLAYFVRRPWSGVQGTFAYDNGNSFTIDYDNGTELKYSAKIHGRLSEQWDVSFDTAIIDNRPSNNKEPWNIPRFSFGGSGTYHFGEQILLTGRFMSYGSRLDQLVLADEVSVQEVDGFIDAQLHLHYAITKNFSASISGINLLNQKNGLWINYPVQGVRVNIGLQYNFNAF